MQGAEAGEPADISRAFAGELAESDDTTFVDLLLANALDGEAAPAVTREYWTG